MVDFDAIIDEHLKRNKREKTLGRYYPSDIPFCVRKTYYGFYINKEINKEKIRLFKMGDLSHEFIADVLARSPQSEKVYSEKSLMLADIDNDFVISGRLDNFVTLKDKDEKPFIVEVKSIKSLGWRGKDGTFHEKDAPQPEHVMQLMPYLKVMNVERGFILYVDKVSGKTKAFEVPFNKEIFNELIMRARVLHTFLKAHELPPPESRNNPAKKWLCGAKGNYVCEYYDECEQDLNPEVKDANKV